MNEQTIEALMSTANKTEATFSVRPLLRPAHWARPLCLTFNLNPSWGWFPDPPPP